MRIKLYKDITTGNLYTFTEVKQEYEVSNNCEISVDDDTMIQIIHENLWSAGGNMEIICDNDPIIKWCNDYAKEMEANRCLTTEEIENSVRDIYYAILDKDILMINEVKYNLFYGNELLDRLNELLKEVGD